MKISRLTYLLISSIALTPAVFAVNGYGVSDVNTNTNIPIPIPPNGFTTSQPAKPAKPANGYSVSQPTPSSNRQSNQKSSTVAQNGYSVQAAPQPRSQNNGYSVSNPQPRPQVNRNGYNVSRQHSQRHNNHNGFSFYVNVPDFAGGFIAGDDGFVPPPPFAEPHWVTTSVGRAIPRNTVSGGGENGHSLFICRGEYRGGLHPGKLVADRCNISWGGREIVLNRYQLLVSGISMAWVSGNYGSIPPDAFPGGFENGNPLFICQANYAGGTHPGKIVGQMCNIPYGGREILIPYYNVLVG